MRKIFSVIIFIFIFCGISNAQIVKKSLYEAKIGNFSGKLEVSFWTDDIIEYSLFINNESGNPVFKQAGYAINQLYGMEHGKSMMYGELIGADPNKFGISASSYFEECKCLKYLNIKVAIDYSMIQINCLADLLKQIFGNISNPNPYPDTLGFFYLKSSNK